MCNWLLDLAYYPVLLVSALPYIFYYLWLTWLLLAKLTIFCPIFHVYIPLDFHRYTIKLLGQFHTLQKLTAMNSPVPAGTARSSSLIYGRSRKPGPCRASVDNGSSIAFGSDHKRLTVSGGFHRSDILHVRQWWNWIGVDWRQPSNPRQLM